MLKLETGMDQYWAEQFEVTSADLEYLYNIFLEEETPIRTPDLIQRLIAHRIDNEAHALQRQLNRGRVFRPSESYTAGQSVVFPKLQFAGGTVKGQRPGVNPTYGDFTVIEVEFEDGKRREFASNLTGDHQLNDTPDEIPIEKPDPAKIYNKHKRTLTQKVVDALKADQDTLFITGRWFLKSLVVPINQGFLNLAEAVLDIHEGGPLETPEIASQIDFGINANPILQSVSLDYALSKDDRFDEVGPAGKVWWFLKRMEPAEILDAPSALRYQRVEFNPRVLTDDLLDLSGEIDDEHSSLEPLDEDELEDHATIALTYPHWRMGTLPLTQRVDHLFPVAYRAPRIRTTLIDVKGNRTLDGWIVREYGYVYGLGDFYQRHQLPVGAYITLRHDDKGLMIDFKQSKQRSARMPIARPDKDKLRIVEGKQTIGADYDDLLVMGVEDIAGIDAIAEKARNRSLVVLLKDIMPELARFSPQEYVHAKTLYSAVNILRRCPPEPVFATLANHPDFINTGGPYWRLA